MTDYGFRISKNGVDVKTGDDKDMVITSKYPVLKGAFAGGGTQTCTSGEITTITVNHALGYIPFAITNFYSADYGFWWPNPIGFDGPSGHLYMRSYCTTSNLYIKIDWEYVDDPDIDITYKYFIYLDKGKL